MCGSPFKFLGESRRIGLCFVLTAVCTKCSNVQKMYTSEILKLEEKHHYASNLGAVLGQIATGGGGAQLEEQLMCMDIPTLSTHSFISLKKSFGAAFENLVTEELLSAGKEEKEYAITNNIMFQDVPACTVIVDGGWSK